MSMEGYLADRADRADRNRELAKRDAALREWLNQTLAPEVRLVRFDAWLRGQLDQRLDWAWAGLQQEKRREQCRIQIDGMVIDLWRRGWMLDGRRLAARIEAMLDAIGKAQRAGQVRDFWPYFKASVARYVGLNAEEIREEAMSAGAAVGDVFAALTRHAAKAPSIPELVAQRSDETLRERLARQRAQDARKAAESAQLGLF